MNRSNCFVWFYGSSTAPRTLKHNTETKRQAIAFKCLVVGGLLAASASVLAVTDQEISAAQRQAEQLQREEQLRQREQLRRDQKSSKPPTRLKAPLVEPRGGAAGPCRNIVDIRIKGNTLLSAEAIQQVTTKFAGRCLGVVEIEQLLGELTNAYIRIGYATVRAYLPQQDLSGGELEILVVEGQVEKILIEDGGNRSVSIANVAPGVVGKPLNLRDFEQALDQINRLASNNATFDIQPGSETGDSIVVIGNEPTRTYRANISYDNQGSKSTGQEQTGINLGWDNPLGFNDFFSYTYRQATPYDAPDASSKSNGFNYFIPFGYSTLTLSATESAYTSSFTAPSGSTLHSRGSSEQVSMRLERVMHRNQLARWNLAGSVTTKNSKNYLEDVFLGVSSRRLSIFDLDSSFTTRFASGLLTLDAGYVRGLDALNALEDGKNLPAEAPRAQFEKWKFGVSYLLPFQAAGLDWSLASALVGQYAKDVLYGSEQIAVGGIYSVRGFVKNTLAGDHGFYWRNDLGVRLPFTGPAGISGSIRPYLAIDHGRVENRASGVPSGSLTGMAIGAALSFGRVGIDIFSGFPLVKPAFMPREGVSTFFRLNLAL